MHVCMINSLADGYIVYRRLGCVELPRHGVHIR